jgi:hypothetical protein
MRFRNHIAGTLVLCLSLAAAGAQEVRPPVQPDPELVVAEGTVLPIALTTFMNSRSTSVGDTFYAETVYPVWVQQRLVIPRGSLVKGTVTQVARPGRIKGKGRMSIRIDTVQLTNGVSRPLIASFRGLHGPGNEKMDKKKEGVEMDSSRGRDAGQVAAPAGEGAIIGAISGGGKGAGIGAGAGAAVGLVSVLFSRGRELVLEPGTQFDLELKQPLRFAYGEVDFTAQEMDGGRRIQQPRRTDRDDNSGGILGRRGLGLPWPLFVP